MSRIITFPAELRAKQGKSAARALRKEGRLPAIVYGGESMQMLSLPQKEFQKEYMEGNIQSKLIKIELGGKTITAIPREVQLHPVTDKPEHADFQEVKKGEKIKVKIHIRVTNEDKCPGIKKGGVLNIVQRTIEFLCEPENMPQHINIDISSLEIGNNLHINDIELPKGITPLDKSNFAVLSISGRAEEKAETSEGEESEGEE